MRPAEPRSGKILVASVMHQHRSASTKGARKVKANSTWSEEVKTPATASTATSAREKTTIFSAAAPLQLRDNAGACTVAPYPSAGSNASTVLCGNRTETRHQNQRPHCQRKPLMSREAPSRRQRSGTATPPQHATGLPESDTPILKKAGSENALGALGRCGESPHVESAPRLHALLTCISNPK